MSLPKPFLSVGDSSEPHQYDMPLIGGRHIPEIDKKALWRPPQDLGPLERMFDEPRLGLDSETKDPDLQQLGVGAYRMKATGTRMVGVSLAVEDGPKIYLPMGHGDGLDNSIPADHDNLDPDVVLAFLRHGFKRFRGDVVGANLPYDLGWLWEYDIEMPLVNRYRDVQVADPLINELEDSYSLQKIAERCKLPGKNEEALRAAALAHRCDPKKDLWRLQARHVGPYAEDDALRPLQILRYQETLIERDSIQECWDMECRLLPVLVRMMRRGVCVDQERLEAIEKWTMRVEAEQFAIVHELTGVRIPVGEVMNAKLLGQALRAANMTPEQLDVAIGSTATGQDSITKGTLSNINHPVAKALIRARQVSTVRTTFVNGTRKHIGDDGKIHCTFNQIRKTDDKTDATSGVAYGRLSASHPNMQNQPGNSRFSGDNEVGPMWRSIYNAGPGREWCAFDLKQQEPKWSFHYSALLEEAQNRGAEGIVGVRGALELCQKLCDNPMLDTYDPLAEAAHVPRPTAKIMWLARSYGQGDGTLCSNLGKPTTKVTFSFALYKQALAAGYDKYSAKAMAVVPVDSEDGRIARARGSFEWDGAGEEGAAIIKEFDTNMPFLRAAAAIAKERAEANGYIRLISGRRCHFPQGEGSSEYTRKAFNRLIQGTAAEQTKRIMLAVSDDKELDDCLLLQVHDEIDLGLPDEVAVEYRARCAEIMRTAVPMKVPTVVDVEYGKSWGESMSVEYLDENGKKCKRKYEWNLT